MNIILNRIVSALFLFSLVNCQGQENQKYIGFKYGSFDLDKVTFAENMDTLFSKIPHVELEKDINGRKMKIYRVSRAAQDSTLFSYFNTGDGDVEFYVDDKKKLVMVSNRVRVTPDQAMKFVNTARKKYKGHELPAKEDKNIDNFIVAQVDNKLVYIGQICITDGFYKGECSIDYYICAYPQKDRDILTFLTPVLELREYLEK